MAIPAPSGGHRGHLQDRRCPATKPRYLRFAGVALGTIDQALRQILIGLITAYRLTLSPYLGQHCRFVPTCSCYGIEALQRHGTWRGIWLTVRRLLRCHPWGSAGHDPVPEPRRGHRHG